MERQKEGKRLFKAEGKRQRSGEKAEGGGQKAEGRRRRKGVMKARTDRGGGVNRVRGGVPRGIPPLGIIKLVIKGQKK